MTTEKQDRNKRLCLYPKRMGDKAGQYIFLNFLLIKYTFYYSISMNDFRIRSVLTINAVKTKKKGITESQNLIIFDVKLKNFKKCAMSH